MSKNVNWTQVLLVGMSPIFLLASFLEYFGKGERGQAPGFQGKELRVNVFLGLGYQAIEVVMGALLTAVIFSWVYQHRLFDIEFRAWMTIPALLAVDLCFYWSHRTAHRVRWFWAAHVPHHSGEFMNFSTAMRQSLLNAFVGNFIFYIPVVWLGFSPAVVGLLLAVNLSYQFFIHTESIGRLPRWIEYIFNTPSHHRAHHGRNPEYIDANYGGMFIIFDRWFGTFVPERAKVEYGIKQQIRSHNVLVLNVHEMVDLLRDVFSPGPWRERLKHLVMPPEWRRPGHEPVRTWETEEL